MTSSALEDLAVLLAQLDLAAFADLILSQLIVSNDTRKVVIDLVVIVQKRVASSLSVRHNLALLHKTLRNTLLISTLISYESLVLGRDLLNIRFEAHLLSQLGCQLHLVVLKVAAIVLNLVELSLCVLQVSCNVRILQLLSFHGHAQAFELFLEQRVIVGSQFSALLRLDDHSSQLAQLFGQMAAYDLLLLANLSLQVGHAALVADVLLDDRPLLRIKAAGGSLAAQVARGQRRSRLAKITLLARSVLTRARGHAAAKHPRISLLHGRLLARLADGLRLCYQSRLAV